MLRNVNLWIADVNHYQIMSIFNNLIPLNEDKRDLIPYSI
ncbi:uncharacterized protein METZ01_LOCUS376983 [marine metagenome]|uniref:Uncharacterized protein n=1 Tax=marine metagenome TaxID=408172 RepID=A0A382TPX9_9ZZZZ